MSEATAARDLPRLLGERLCLDFANTLDPRCGPRPHDALTNYDDLVRWCGYAGVLAASRAAALLARAGARPDAAAAVFASAIRLREAIFRAFDAIAAAESPDDEDLALIRDAHAEGMARASFVRDGGGFALAWPEAEDDLALPLWPLARSAVDLLTEGNLGRIKRCPSVACGWLFYDVSKNGSRRWCSMAGCGSQAKMRRYRSRHAGDRV